MLKKIKALVVDDSLLMRKVIADILAEDPEIEVVGTAPDGKAALEKIKSLHPDVMTLDVEMPIMDGIECLRRVMKENPLPVVMVSSITYEGGFKTLQALEAGAFDFIQKPKAQSSSSLHNVKRELLIKVKAAVKSGLKKRKPLLDPSPQNEIAPSAETVTIPPKLRGVKTFRDYVIAIGISTGGPPCVSKVFEILPKNSPPVLVVQHMPEQFTKAMADRIDKLSQMAVKEAADGDPILPGKGYIAPGHSHITIVKGPDGARIKLSRQGLVSGHQPSADVLFSSVAETYGKKAIGVIMTGMGRDGATNLKKMRNSGAHTIAQNEESCVVFGMPKMAIQEDAVDEVLSLEGIMLRLKKIAEAKE